MATMFNQPIRSPVLIGREREVSTLGALIEQARQGHGQVLLLSGEAGIGKSRLLAEGKRQASEEGFLLLQGACFPTDRSSPYAPVLDLLSSSHTQELLSLSTVNPEPLARELGRLFPGLLDHASSETASTPIEPEQDKRRLFVALSQFFTGIADTQPLLLTIEDLHWSDETSLEFLHFLARRCSAHPLLLVLTYRHEEMHPALSHWLAQLDRERLAQEFVLTPLSRSEVEAMLRAIFDLKQTMPAATVDALYELTEGNPFFIEEILKSLITAGAIVPTHERWEGRPPNELPIPRSVQGAVQQRLEQVSDAARQVVTLAAVAGRRFDFAFLQRITHHDEAE
jgi:predicted ATPase